jgi:hypothetical protein
MGSGVGEYLEDPGSLYSETLDRRTHAVYPFDRSPITTDRWNFMFLFVRLSHRNMERHLGSQDLTRFPPGDLSWESPAINTEPFNICYRMSMKRVEPGVDYGHFNISPHLTTYIRGTCKFWRDSDTPGLGIRWNPTPKNLRGLPLWPKSIDGWPMELYVCIC